MAKKTWKQVTKNSKGSADPYEGEMYWVDTSANQTGPSRWRIYHHTTGWTDYMGTDPVSDDGVIQCSAPNSGSISFGGGIDLLTGNIISSNDSEAAHPYRIANLKPKVDINGCQCGACKCGGPHLEYCDKFGQPSEDYP